MVVFAGLYLIIGLLIGIVGKDKSCGFWQPFLCSVLLTPILGLIIIAMAKPGPPETHIEKVDITPKCPTCKAVISDSTVNCPNCGKGPNPMTKQDKEKHLRYLQTN